MGRGRRAWISQTAGSYHLISRVVGDNTFLTDYEKEYFLKLLERLSTGFFVNIHAFCVMGNHFHIMATGLEKEAAQATEKELLKRYRIIYGKGMDPPIGSYETNGSLVPDEDGGIERLRRRLGSISRFMQELKQTFSRWYNKRHDRKGYLWGDRFKGVMVHKGEAELKISTYIELNSVRAGLSKSPDDYRWCSLGLFARNPDRTMEMLNPIDFRGISKKYFRDDNAKKLYSDIAALKENNQDLDLAMMEMYRLVVYGNGGIERRGKSKIPDSIIKDIFDYYGKLRAEDNFRFRIKNFSEGIAVGSYSFIEEIQKRYNRKFIRPRPLLKEGDLYTTRVLRKSSTTHSPPPPT
jgi:putative transposase